MPSGLPIADSKSQTTKRRSPSRQAKLAALKARPSTASAWPTEWTRLAAPAPSKRFPLAPTLRSCSQRPRPPFTDPLLTARRSATWSANWPTPATCAACALPNYYNRSCNSGDNPAWELSVCYHFVDKCRRAENLLAILGACGARYDSRLDSWWFDSWFSLDPCGVLQHRHH